MPAFLFINTLTIERKTEMEKYALMLGAKLRTNHGLIHIHRFPSGHLPRYPVTQLAGEVDEAR